MSWFTGILVFVVVWWVVIFAVLPWGIRVPDRQDDAGHAPSAPTNPRIWLKAIVTTAIAAVIWLGIYFLVESDWLSFRGP
jgi:predicted secreted protein